MWRLGFMRRYTLIMASLDTTERTAMRRALHQVLSTLATSGARRQIGVCQDCAHFGRKMCGNRAAGNPGNPGGRDFASIADVLNERGIKSARGGKWHVSSVANVLSRTQG
jgi:hypothetical protein